MENIDILKKLGKKEHKAEDIARNITRDPTLLPQVFKAISSRNARVKFKSAKALRLMSETNPETLYSKMDFFVDLLDSDNNILKWTAMDIVANLTPIDTRNKFDKILDKYYRLLSAKSMITIGHVIYNSGKIAKAKPHLTKRITDELLEIENLPTKPPITQECRNILIGKTILAFDNFFEQTENKADIISFVKRQLNNPRNATKLKAQKFLKNTE